MAEGQGEGQGSAADSMSIGDFVSDVFGDEPEAESPPVATSDAAGAPPAERQTTASEAAPKAPEDSKTAERADTPSADAAKTESDKGATPTTEDTDPLATATPFTYAVNGQDKTFDGIKVLGDAGAIITSEALPLLQRRLGERDNLYEQNKSQYEAIQGYERLSEWKTQGEDGKEVTLTGRDGLVAQRTSSAALEASFNTLVSAFKPDAQGNYSLLSQLIDVDPTTNKIIVNAHALDNLLTKAELAEARAIQSVTQRLAAITGPKATTSGPSAGQATQTDFSTVAPQVIEQAAKESGIDGKLLTEKDRVFLAQQLPRYVRQVTEEDRRDNLSLKIGNPIVDGAFAQVVKDRAEMRKEMGQSAVAATNAAKENAAKLAAAAVGQRTPATPQKVQERKPEDTRVSDADKAWALRERLSSGHFSTQ